MDGGCVQVNVTRSRKGNAMQATPRYRPAGVRALWTVLACALVLALAGCVSGDGVQDSFLRQFSNDPAVARVDLSTVDNMPFTGGVGGTVFLNDSVSEAEVRAFAERVRGFSNQNVDDQRGSRVRIKLVADGWTFPVLASATANESLLDLVYQLRADSRVDSGSLGSKNYQADIDHATLVSPATTGMGTLITDAPAAFAAKGMAPSITLRSPAGEPGTFSVSGHMGPWAESAFHTYEALSTEIRLTSFKADEDAITVTLAQESDLNRARDLTQAALDPTQTAVFYQSELVTLFPGARGDQARILLAAVDTGTRANLVSVWTDDRSATFTMKSTAGLQQLAHTISENRGSITLDSVTLAVGQGDALTFSLQASPGDLAAKTHTAVTLMDQDHVTRLTLKPGFSIALDLEPTASDDDLAGYAALLKTLSAFDERLCVDWTTNSFCATTAPTIDPKTIRGGGNERGRAFVDAWNSAK